MRASGFEAFSVSFPVTLCSSIYFLVAAFVAVLFECGELQFESTAPTAMSDRGCTDRTVCAAPQYEAVPAGTHNDRTCSPLTDCVANQWQDVAPTASSDRHCAPLTVCSDSQFRTLPHGPTNHPDKIGVVVPPSSDVGTVGVVCSSAVCVATKKNNKNSNTPPRERKNW